MLDAQQKPRSQDTRGRDVDDGGTDGMGIDAVAKRIPVDPIMSARDLPSFLEQAKARFKASRTFPVYK